LFYFIGLEVFSITQFQSLPEVKYYENQIEVLEEEIRQCKNTISELPEVKL
jgi:flagellar biosynthesis chaperone FliJ